MPYVLGIDVGASRTRAAVSHRTSTGWSEPVVVGLGERGPEVPTVVYLAPDRSVLVGDQAERHAGSDPTRIAREFTDRIGDDVPLMLGGAACTAQELAAVLVRWVVDRVAEHEGGPAERLVVTHRASWGGHRKNLMHHELTRQGLPDTTLLAAPIAVAEGNAGARLATGDVLATFGLGSGTAEAAVMRRTPGGTFELLASAEGVDHLGGGYFDDAIVECVRGHLGRALDDLDPADPPCWLAMARLRGICAGAKEMLSSEVEVIVPVELPDAPQDVNVSRTEFERIIRPAVTAGAELMPRVARAAGVQPQDVTVTALVGGSVRVPLVAELVGAALPAKVVTSPEPAAATALGAAQAARRMLTGPDFAVVPPEEAAERTETIQRSAIDLYTDEGTLDPAEVDDHFGIDPPSRPPIEITPLDLPERRLMARLMPGIRPAALTVSTIVVVAVGVVLTFMFESGSGGGTSPTSPLHINPPQPAANQSAATASGGDTGH
jgi:molecular chaperone DnaK